MLQQFQAASGQALVLASQSMGWLARQTFFVDKIYRVVRRRPTIAGLRVLVLQICLRSADLMTCRFRFGDAHEIFRFRSYDPARFVRGEA